MKKSQRHKDTDFARDCLQISQRKDMTASGLKYAMLICCYVLQFSPPPFILPFPFHSHNSLRSCQNSSQVWTLTLDTPKPLFLFCFVSYLTQRGDDVHKDTRITEKKRFQQDDVMQSKVEKHGVVRPSTLMLHCCTSTAQLALSADSWGSKLKAIICKLTHNFIG